MAAQAMASNMDEARGTGKKVPQRWEEMEVFFGRPVDEQFPYVVPTRRYAFITNDVRVQDGRILLVMRSPFRDVRLYTAWCGGIAHGVRERGRWAIVQDEKSVIHARYIPEDIVVGAFARAGVLVPVPDGLGEWPLEVAYRQDRNATITAGCVAFGFPIAILLTFRMRRANKAREATSPTSRS
jgi:hypothetical protein